MKARIAMAALGLIVLVGCNKSKKEATCEEVAGVAEKWAEKSKAIDPALLRSMTIDQCTEDKWSASFKKCVVASFGTDDPMAAGRIC